MEAKTLGLVRLRFRFVVQYTGLALGLRISVSARVGVSVGKLSTTYFITFS